MKKEIYSFLFVFFFLFSFAHKTKRLPGLDSLTQVYTAHKEKREIAYSFKNIASIYNGDNNVKQALDYYSRSLKVYEEINDKEGIANSLFNLGKIYNTQQNRKQALNYRDKSVKLQEEIKKQIESANSLNKLAYNCNKKSDIKQALDLYNQSLKIYFEVNDKVGIINSLNNIGTIYVNKGDKKQGLEYFNLSYKIKTESKKRIADIKSEMNSADGIAYSLNNIAAIYLKQNNFLLARAYSDSALLTSKELNYLKSICKAESLLTKIDSSMAKLISTTALQKEEILIRARSHYEQYIVFRDSVNKQAKQKTAIEKQIINKSTNISSEQNRNEKNKNSLFILIPVGLLVVVFSYVFIKKRKNK